MQSPLRMSSSHNRHPSYDRRHAFTMIELLVVIAIILILTAATIASFNYSVNADRVRAAARQFQSFLAGARDKAIQANDIRGVRLLLDPNDNHAVGAMQYIGSPQHETGKLQPDPSDPTNQTMVIPLSESPTRWTTLKNRGFLKVGCRIQIPAPSGQWYTVTAIVPDPSNNQKLILNQAVTIFNGYSPGNIPSAQYILELASNVLGEAQPVVLPRGVVIDLDGSTVPGSWRPPSGSAFSTAYATTTQMDILFTPGGRVIGDCATLGMVHLHFAETFDVDKWHQLPGRSSADYSAVAAAPPSIPPVPADTQVLRNRITATLAARTGHVGVYYVNGKSASSGQLADDPFSFAETGRLANK